MNKQVNDMKQELVQTEVEMISQNMTPSFVKNYKVRILRRFPSAWVLFL